MKILPSLAVAILAAPVLLGTSAAHARGRVVVLRPSKVSILPHLAPSKNAIKRIANAQLLPETTARSVELQGDSLSIGLGDVVLLPIPNVTRIITEDDEVARAYFQNGSPVLQGVSVGVTTVEIYQASNSPRVLTVSVVAKATATPDVPPTPVPTNTPEPAPQEGTNMPPGTEASGGVIINPQPTDPTAPSTMVETPPAPDPSTTTIESSRSALSVALRAVATPGNPSQATFTVSYANPGATLARSAVVRFALTDDRVSYVTGSASNGGQYDPSRREVVWNVGDVTAGFKGGQLSLRVEPVQRSAFAFDSQATVEDASGSGPIASAQVRYSTTTTPLLTVFAMPDRFLAATNGPALRDVSGETQIAVNRLQQLGVVSGDAPGLYSPKRATQRAEYAVMTLNGLNLRDLRDTTQIKFVLSRRSAVSLIVQNAAGVRVADLIRATAFEAGEHTVMWDGKVADGFAAPGRYTYVCTAKDARGEVTTLRGTLSILANAPLALEGQPSFADVKPSDWFARYLAVGEKQGLFFGFPDKTFRPRQPISRVEATAIIVRALGMSDMARQWGDKDVGFQDYADIPAWARGAVNVATTQAKTAAGRPMFRGTPDNKFEPNSQLRRDQAALVVQRLIDRETTRRITVSGAIVPGAIVSINSRPISADGNGIFNFDLDMTTSAPTTVAVVDTRGNGN